MSELDEDDLTDDELGELWRELRPDAVGTLPPDPLAWPAVEGLLRCEHCQGTGVIVPSNYNNGYDHRCTACDQTGALMVPSGPIPPSIATGSNARVAIYAARYRRGEAIFQRSDDGCQRPSHAPSLGGEIEPDELLDVIGGAA